MKKKISKEIERLLDLMTDIKDTIQLREYALVVESLVISLSRIKE